MEAIRNYVMEKYERHPEAISVVLTQNPGQISYGTDGPDVLVLVISPMAQTDFTTYYIKDDIRIQERCLHPDKLEQWLWSGANRNVIHWIVQGEIVMDRKLYIEDLRHTLKEFPEALRAKKMIVEFDRFLKSFLQGKQYLLEGHLLDAYSNILAALCHWARITIIEEGIHPEALVWTQVRKINPGVYKFYEELTSNHESMEKRIHLVVLACEFSVMSKMESCCSELLRVLGSREAPWTLQELMIEPQLAGLDLDVPLLLNKLARKSLIREVVEPCDGDDPHLLQMKYVANPQAQLCDR